MSAGHKVAEQRRPTVTLATRAFSVSGDEGSNEPFRDDTSRFYFNCFDDIISSYDK